MQHGGDATRANRVKVGVRVRPLSQAEAEQGAITAITSSGKGKSIFANGGTRSSKYDFDWTFGPSSNQSEVINITSAQERNR